MLVTDMIFAIVVCGHYDKVVVCYHTRDFAEVADIIHSDGSYSVADESGDWNYGGVCNIGDCGVETVITLVIVIYDKTVTVIIEMMIVIVMMGIIMMK